jgi:tetratricopeptide (TPR) repeat protein
MVVTFPLTLLLLDYWPLGRFKGRNWRGPVLEKVPLFLLAIAHSIVTIAVQSRGGSADYGARFSIAARLGNAAVSCVRYLGKTFWPARLSPFYAHPGYWPAWMVAGSAALLLAATALAWMQRRERPWLLFGWLWFLVTLAPVIGLVQVGAQSMADRYTYIPLLGIFTIAAWAGGELAARFPKTRAPLAAAGCAAVAACFFVTKRQAGVWENSVQLYEKTIAAGEDNATLRYLLAQALQAARRPPGEVKTQYERAIALQHDYVNAWLQLCIMAIGSRDYAGAQRLVGQALQFEPRNPAIHADFGALRRIMGDPAGAAAHLQDALKIDPSFVPAHRELAAVYFGQQRFGAARDEY